MMSNSEPPSYHSSVFGNHGNAVHPIIPAPDYNDDDGIDNTTLTTETEFRAYDNVVFPSNSNVKHSGNFNGYSDYDVNIANDIPEVAAKSK